MEEEEPQQQATGTEEPSEQQQPTETEDTLKQDTSQPQQEFAPVADHEVAELATVATTRSREGVGRDEATAPQEVDDITTEEIKAFRTSILARRFPGLKNLSDEDVGVMLLGHLKAGGARPEVRQKTFPKTEKQRGEKKTRHDPVWWPNNAREAKDSIVLEPEKAFVGMFSPYDADREDFLEKKHSDSAKVVSNAPFAPSSWSEAKRTTEVDYFINSATAAEKELQKRSLRERANFMTGEFQDVYSTRRGKKLT